MNFNSLYTGECPDFSTPDKKVLEKFRDSQHFNDTRKGLKYGGIRSVV